MWQAGSHFKAASVLGRAGNGANSKKILGSLRREVETKVAVGRYLRYLRRRRVAVCAEPDKLYDKPNRRKIMKINKTDETTTIEATTMTMLAALSEGSDKK